jgi:hypothetical protein
MRSGSRILVIHCLILPITILIRQLIQGTGRHALNAAAGNVPMSACENLDCHDERPQMASGRSFVSSPPAAKLTPSRL